MKPWAQAEPMDPWAHGLSPGPKKNWRRAGTRAQGRANFFFDPGLSPWAHGSMGSARAHDFIIISCILICSYTFPYFFHFDFVPKKSVLGRLDKNCQKKVIFQIWGPNFPKNVLFVTIVVQLSQHRFFLGENKYEKYGKI